MKNKLKLFGIGIIGGIIPLTAFLTFNMFFDLNKENPKLYLNHVNDNATQITGKKTSSRYGIISSNTDFVNASSNTLNSVVHVTTKVETTSFQRDIFSEFFYGPGAGGREYKQYGSGSGSGVIVSTDGYIVTNNHVIENAKEIEVTLNDNRKYNAKIIGADPSTDIAVLKIEEKGLVAIPIGNSDNIQVGEWVLAVGNPFNLTSTVTAGIVSAKARNINLLSERSNSNIVPIESFIQTDAAVNPGNSGGALVNTNGELVGINTAIASKTGSYTGYSFAVPVNLVKKVMTDLVDYGIVQRGYLGVQITNITQELVEEKNLKNIKGVYVAGVLENGSAKKAGVKEGDVILKIGLKTVNSVASLQEEVGKRRPGDKVNITIRNDKGNEVVKEIILRNSDGETKLVSKEEIKKNVALGATFVEITNKEKKELNILTGVKIKSLNTGKLKSLGLKEGMIILKINNETVESVEQVTSKLNSSNRGILLEIITESGKREFVGFGL
ncbi:MAG: deoxyribonuclease HsdR [Crocinitomicaceae bacterium]|nr:deoxyribonuclease HsdR [Crocinitomicaceae bacterium]|tara:strand:- start:132492 stop:133985 length:1494 start_codon:yes stop_codon:yes gene_type:complete